MRRDNVVASRPFPSIFNQRCCHGLNGLRSALTKIGVGSGNLLKKTNKHQIEFSSGKESKMSSSVLGLGAAGLGSAAMRMPGFKKENKSKKVSASQGSAQDYLNSYMAAISNQKLSEKRRVDAFFGGPVKSLSGNFYYGEAPKKIPEGAFVVQGQSIGVPGRGPNEGSFTKEIETYQIVRPQAAQPQPAKTTQTEPLRLDLSQGGRVDVLNRKDIKHAVAQGATMKEVRQAAKSQDLRVSAKAKSMLQKDKQNKK